MKVFEVNIGRYRGVKSIFAKQITKVDFETLDGSVYSEHEPPFIIKDNNGVSVFIEANSKSEAIYEAVELVLNKHYLLIEMSLTGILSEINGCRMDKVPVIFV